MEVDLIQINLNHRSVCLYFYRTISNHFLQFSELTLNSFCNHLQLFTHWKWYAIQNSNGFMCAYLIPMMTYESLKHFVCKFSACGKETKVHQVLES